MAIYAVNAKVVVTYLYNWKRWITCFSNCMSRKLRIYSCNCHQINMKWKCPSCRKDFSLQNHKQLYVSLCLCSFISYDPALCLFVHADPQPHPTLAPPTKRLVTIKNWHFLNHLIGEIHSDTAHYPSPLPRQPHSIPTESMACSWVMISPLRSQKLQTLPAVASTHSQPCDTVQPS